jgi:hypothetical protein
LCRDTQNLSIHNSAIFNFTFHLVKEHSGVKTSQLISLAFCLLLSDLTAVRNKKQRRQLTDFFSLAMKYITTADRDF